MASMGEVGTFHHQQPNPYLMASSTVFIIPLYYANRIGNRPVQFICGSLTAVSLLYHATKHPFVFWLDQTAVWTFIVRSVIEGLRGGPKSLLFVAAANLTSAYLYVYGRYSKSLIWSDRYGEATATHAAMHLIAAAGYVGCMKWAEKPLLK